MICISLYKFGRIVTSRVGSGAGRRSNAKCRIDPSGKRIRLMAKCPHCDKEVALKPNTTNKRTRIRKEIDGKIKKCVIIYALPPIRGSEQCR